jgi:hypothetical protein
VSKSVPLGRTTLKLDDNIKMYLLWTRCVVAERINLVQRRVTTRVLVNKKIKLGFHKTRRNIWPAERIYASKEQFKILIWYTLAWEKNNPCDAHLNRYDCYVTLHSQFVGVFHRTLQSPRKIHGITSNKTGPLPSTPFHIHDSLVILPHNAIYIWSFTSVVKWN